MREPRSIFFCAWAGLAVQSALAAGVIAFVLAGQGRAGTGLGGAGAILALGLIFPVLAVAAGLRWLSGPLHAVTAAVRRAHPG